MSRSLFEQALAFFNGENVLGLKMRLDLDYKSWHEEASYLRWRSKMVKAIIKELRGR